MPHSARRKLTYRYEFLENEGRVHEDMWKSFFVNLKIGISQLYYELTSSQILSKRTPSNGYFSFLYKVLEKRGETFR